MEFKMSVFRKANKKKSKLRMALCAPSGAGKTYGALTIAQGLGGRIAVIDTECGSADLYSDKFDYDVCTITAPYTPEKYIKCIKDAEKEGYDTIIVDSLSHAWSGEGGVLDMQDSATKASSRGNSYTAWREVTPHHNALVNTILQSSCHIIATMRTKVAYEMKTDSKGKMVPIKIGLAPIQREGMDYEFTLVFDISVDGHIATASKDRTSIFDGQFFKIDTSIGFKLNDWLNKADKFDLDASIKEIEACNDIDNLKEVFTKINRIVKSYPDIDQSIVKKIISKKDSRKNELTITDKENKEQELESNKNSLMDAIKNSPIVDHNIIDNLSEVIQQDELKSKRSHNEQAWFDDSWNRP
jgi:hypothetical protein